MNITRHNYEEYFILYMDNELGAEERRQVELFVHENPDLQQELDWLLQTRLVPETTVVFDQKPQLLKQETEHINITNYRDWLLLYTDDELTGKEKAIADNLIATHSFIKTEWELLQKTKLRPEPVVFRNKEVLYRKEEKVRVISLHWRRIAVAAVLLLTVGSTVFIALNRKNDASIEPVAQEQTNQKPGAEQKSTPLIPATVEPANSIAATNTGKDDISPKINEEVNSTVKQEAQVKQREATQAPLQQDKVNSASLADNRSNDRGTNNLPLPTYNPNVNPSLDTKDVLAKAEMPLQKDLTNINENNPIIAVTRADVPSLNNARTTDYRESVDPIEEEQPGKKNRLRGFFRKVTRTIEKTTNIKATDDQDRLLLAGFAVKL